MDGEVVERREVERVGDVDDDLAVELGRVLPDDLGNGTVREREDSDVARQRVTEPATCCAGAEGGGSGCGVLRVTGEDLNGRATLERDGGDRRRHRTDAEDAERGHVFLGFTCWFN